MTNRQARKVARREATRRYVIDTYAACCIAYPDAARAVVSRKVIR